MHVYVHDICMHVIVSHNLNRKCSVTVAVIRSGLAAVCEERERMRGGKKAVEEISYQGEGGGGGRQRMVLHW